MALLNDTLATSASSKATTNLSSLFASSKKVVITAYGSARLLCFDQIFAYIINVTNDKEPSFTCAGVISFDLLPDGEITSIKVNADLTRAVLVGKYYAYCFTIPDTRALSVPQKTPLGVSNELLENKTIVSLITIGPMPNNSSILKVKWLESSVIKRNYRYADFLGLLYFDSVIRIIDVKFPQKEYNFDFKPAVLGSVKEDQFKTFGLSKVIVSFDFGPIFSNTFVTVFAIDNDSEMYYTGFALSTGNIKLTPIIGPVVFKNANANSEPLDLTFIRHPKIETMAVFAIPFDNGTLSHLVALPFKSWNLMMTGEQCLSFFVQDIIELQGVPILEVTNDLSTPGEYLVSTPHHVYMVSILPWLTELLHALQVEAYTPKDLSSVACHVFQLVTNASVFESVVILADPPITEDYERWIVAYDSESAVHSRLIPTIFHVPTRAKDSLSSTQETSNEAPYIQAVPAPADVPKMKNDTNISQEEALQLFSNIFKKLSSLASNNINLTNDVIKKAEGLIAVNDKLLKDDEELLKRIVTVADESKELQPKISEYSKTAEKLIRRCDRAYNSIPREKMSDVHLENEARLYKSKEAIQKALAETREASMRAIMLRSDHVRRQPSFQPSVGAVRFMLTRSSLSSDELKNEVDKLAAKVGKLATVADYAKRME